MIELPKFDSESTMTQAEMKQKIKMLSFYLTKSKSKRKDYLKLLENELVGTEDQNKLVDKGIKMVDKTYKQGTQR